MFTWNWVCIILEQVEGASERLSSDLTPIRQMTALTTPRYEKDFFFKPMSCKSRHWSIQHRSAEKRFICQVFKKRQVFKKPFMKYL